MDKILGLVFGVKEAQYRCDDSFSDRLSRRYTSGLFMLFALLVTTGTYVGERIACWCPAQFTDTHKAYANEYCWIQSTFYAPLEEDLPDNDTPKHLVNYYQWVPLILLLQAFLAYLPSVMWRVMCRRSGLNISALVDAAISGQKTTYVDIREKTVEYMIQKIHRYLKSRGKAPGERGGGNRGRHQPKVKSMTKYCCSMHGRLIGNYLLGCYMFTKLVYFGNAVGQLYLLDLFLGKDFHFYGVEAFRRLINGQEWMTSERFPRVTMCEFQMRHMNQLHRYVVQCILPTNLFNEKIFLVVWFWLFALAVITLLSFCAWIWRCCFWPGEVLWVKHRIKIYSDVKYQKDTFRQFTANYLRGDGMFVLRIISHNVGNIAASEVVSGLWDKYGAERQFAAVLAGGRSNGPARPDRRRRAESVEMMDEMEVPLQRRHRKESI